MGAHLGAELQLSVRQTGRSLPVAKGDRSRGTRPVRVRLAAWLTPSIAPLAAQRVPDPAMFRQAPQPAPPCHAND